MIKLLLHLQIVMFFCYWLIVATFIKTITLPIAIWLNINDRFRGWLHSLPHKMRKYLVYYDSCGLKHAHVHIDSINVHEFFTRTFEEQAEYANEFIVHFCKAGQTSNPNLAEVLPPLHRNEINVTGIANAAYVILHHPDMNERETAYKTLNDIEKILNQ